ncbi:peroxisomal 2,4-dienoyl-CoA reductase [(3E)-enoyl-CoA-producing]-like [Garra rufa]|uniref:peroxisomal 2,4-dienoyl-CoA reductase [(3E)-enoyl-CoA-producing]-like n=1 Tax=Garra rufa TaxID=137080 RepID=UPI003CCED5D6
MEDKIMVAVCGYPELYDISSYYYRNRNKKDLAWKKVNAMTRHLAVEWGPSGVRVNTVSPGPISGTEGYRRLGGSHAESAGAFHSIPLQRAGNKTEMAHAVLFLASRAASYVTGAILVADGGAWLTSANDVEQLLGYWSAEKRKDK